MGGGTKYLAVLSLLPAAALAQSLLLRVPAPDSPPEVRWRDKSGNQTSTAQPASLSNETTVLIDGPALAAPGLSAALGKLLTARGRRTIQLIALIPGQETRSIEAATRLQLSAAIRNLVASAARDAQPASFDSLLLALESLPSDQWKQVVYIGLEPALAPELRDYAYGRLLRTLATRRILLSHAYSRETGEPAWAPYLTAFGGRVSPETPASLVEAGDSRWFEYRLPSEGPPEGFRVASIEFQAGSEPVRTIPWVWAAAGASTPGLPEYQAFLARGAGLRAPTATVADFQAVLAINPSDLDALRLAIDFSGRARDTASAVRYGARIVALEPENGAYWARLGIDYWQLGDADNAERCILQARKKGVDPPQSAAILGDVRSGKKDYSTAAAHYREAVNREPARTELWLKLAGCEQSLGRKPEAAQALEEALKRKPDLWPSRTQLIDYYLQASDRTAAARHVAAAIPLLPPDAPMVIRFATYCEQLQRGQDARGLWTRAVELDPAGEPAHYSLARNYAATGSWEEALAAAEDGFRAAPQSARLAALDADALIALARIEAARRFLKSTIARLPDADLLRRSADLEDRYGSDSAGSYKGLVETMAAGNRTEADWRPYAARGLAASIRESDTESCHWFAARLHSTLCEPNAPGPDAATVIVRGGIRSLLLMARGPENSSPEAFLADYSRTLADNLPDKRRNHKGSGDAYRNRLIEYFRLLADLEAMGQASPGKIAVHLSLQDQKASRVTERVLSLIGWRTRRDSGMLIVEPTLKGKRARRQDLGSALAIDVVSMQERLQSGRDFVLEIENAPVDIFPSEKMWQDQFYHGERYAGGFVEAMARNSDMTALYAALSNMEQSSAALLVQSVGMKPLAEKYSPLLTLYASCLQISAGRVEVPGGVSAAPVWASLAHAQPTDPRRFLRELLDRDDGRLLKFYFLLSQLDFRRQRFFTASAKRTKAFYDVFRDSAQAQSKTSRKFGSASIQDLFRELPIDSEGELEFPGSPEVWMVAKGKSNSVQATDRRLKKVSRVTTPEVEDEILLRLIKGEYTQNHTLYGNWQNLLAVLRVDARHAEPLDEASALMLAEKFSSAEGLYGYFAELTGLQAPQYREIFGFVEKMRALDWKQANLPAGLFHSVLYLLASAENSRRLKPDKTAAMAGGFTKAMNQAQTPGQWARVTLDFLGSYLQVLGASRHLPSLRELLVSVPKESTFTFADQTFAPGEDLRRSFDRVLELQSVPKLDELLVLHDALSKVASGNGDPRPYAKTIVDIAKNFRDPEIPRHLKLPPALAASLGPGRPARMASLNSRLQKEAGKKKLSKNLPKFAADYWDAIAFRTLLALAGQVYAANFRSDDPLIANDTLFLRKHSFVIASTGSTEYFPTAGLNVSSEGAGSRGEGGFDGIAAIAGASGAGELRSLDPNTSFVAAAMIGSIRTTDWSRLKVQTLRATAVAIHAAQDWLVMAADRSEVFDTIAVSTYGLLSLNRRARLLSALQRHDWDVAWSSLSLSDLLFLAAGIRSASPRLIAKSPAIDEYLASAEAFPDGVSALGPALPTLRGDSTPTMTELRPYEDTATELYPVYLAERLAEFKLYLGYLFAREGLPEEGLPTVAEIAARDVLGGIQMADYRDWQAVLSAYSGFDGARLREVMTAK